MEPSREKQAVTPDDGLQVTAVWNSPSHQQNVPASYYSPPDEKSDHSQQGAKPHRLPWGLAPLGFGVLVALTTAIIVGAAVGGGVGSLAASRKSSTYVVFLPGVNRALRPWVNLSQTTGVAFSTITATSTVTLSSSATSSSSPAPSSLVNFTVTDPSAIASLGTKCPELDLQIFTAAAGGSYKILCGVGYSATNGPGPNGFALYDYTGIVAYTLDACIEACSKMNGYSAAANRTDGHCSAVTFVTALAKWYDNSQANCW